MSEPQASYESTAAGSCRNCKRTLTDPKSVTAGIGPICAGKIATVPDERLKEVGMEHIPVPIQDGILLKRLPRRSSPGPVIATNVPWMVVSHSPSGFEWGYSGSGPADLALNIIEAGLHALGFKGRREKTYEGSCFHFAFEIYQEFKERFIAPMPVAGGTIPWATVRDFIHDRIARKLQVEGGPPR